MVSPPRQARPSAASSSGNLSSRNNLTINLTRGGNLTRQVNFPALAKQMAECYQAVGVKQGSQQGAQAKSGARI